MGVPRNILLGLVLLFTSCIVSEATNSSTRGIIETKTPLAVESRRRSVFSFRAPKITVRIQNLLPNDESLKIHCWSGDDDMGEHVLGFGDSFHWRFRVNFWFTTKFKCATISRHGSMTIDIYRAKRDSDFRCPEYCFWFANATGVNGFRQDDDVADIAFLWPTSFQ